jgi:hypothetical protein
MRNRVLYKNRLILLWHWYNRLEWGEKDYRRGFNNKVS